MVLRIAAAHLAAHGGIAAAPEAAEIARHLQWPPGWREQMQEQRDPAARNARRVARAEQLLETHREHRHLAAVVEGHARAARHRDMRRRQALQRLLLVPGEPP